MPFFYGMNPLYWLFMIPGLLFSLWAQWKVQSAYGKYKQIANTRNITGAQAARYLFDSSGLGDFMPFLAAPKSSTARRAATTEPLPVRSA